MFRAGFASVLSALCITLLLILPFLDARPAQGEVQGGEHVTFILASTSDLRGYGLYLEAPGETGCAAVRYTVAAPGPRSRWATPPLSPGQGVVLRIGRGFAPGRHALRIAAIGCPRPPAGARRVILDAASPDHAWRQTPGLRAGR